MKRELSKDDLEQQIEEKKRDLKAHASTLEHEAEFAGQTAKDNALKIGGGVAAAVALLALLRSGGRSSSEDAPTRSISETYADRLALEVENRLAGGDTLTEALIATLRREAPVTLYDPSASSSTGSSVLKTLLTMGVAAAVSYGLNLLAKQQTGKDAATLVQEQLGRQRRSSNAGARRPASSAGAGTSATGAANVYPSTYGDLEEDFRAHHRTTFGDAGGDYAEYEPAYRHGLTYATREEHRAKDYDALEPDIRRTYEERHGEGSFSKADAAARHAFERGRTADQPRSDDAPPASR